ncbi:MAG TPA: hypothetical protein VFI31_17940 [Pirellulales bacterium]|nr:hypothetical protein [Pirellulales bacterium]
MEDSDDSFLDVSGRERVRRRSHESEADERASAGGEPEVFDADRELPGAVLMVPNRHWGFEVESAADHPGACTEYEPGETEAIFVHGTDADRIRSLRNYFIVEATEQNGLKKRTAFKLTPHVLRLHKIKLLFANRYLGRLEQGVFEALKTALARRNAEEET